MFFWCLDTLWCHLHLDDTVQVVYAKLVDGQLREIIDEDLEELTKWSFNYEVTGMSLSVCVCVF